MDGGQEGRDDQETSVSGCGGQLPNGGAPTAGRMWVLCYGEGGAGKERDDGGLGEKTGLPSINGRLDFSATLPPGLGVPGTIKFLKLYAT
jgi:hypothetical protein